MAGSTFVTGTSQAASNIDQSHSCFPQVYWYESMIMAIMYLGYIGVMFVNPQLETWAQSTKKKLRTKVFPSQPSESTPLHHTTTVTATKSIQVVQVCSCCMSKHILKWHFLTVSFEYCTSLIYVISVNLINKFNACNWVSL